MKRTIAEVTFHRLGDDTNPHCWTFEQFELEQPDRARCLRDALGDPPADPRRSVIALPLIEAGVIVGVFRAHTRPLH